MSARAGHAGLIVLVLLAVATSAASAGQGDPVNEHRRSITDTSVDMPGAAALWRTLTLRDYNTRVVVIGTTLLGIAAGVVGTFAYLRKRSLMGDALSHATLPGIAAAFMLTGDKKLGPLLAGAALTGLLGVLAVTALRRWSRLKEDAAIGIVLSVFFAMGMVLFSLIQQQGTGAEAGLRTFIYGKAAAMVARDARLIGWTALVVIVGAGLLFKEFRVVCFDAAFAGASGFPVVVIDLLMMALVVATTVIGLQAVGLILVVALLIIPAAAARFWTDHLTSMTVLAATIGALSGWLGSTVSALVPRLPAGAVIVISAGALFLVSMFLAPRRGVLAEVVRRWALSRKVAFQHLLRALAELEERHGGGAGLRFDDVFARRSWSPNQLQRLIRRAVGAGVLTPAGLPLLQLTDSGRAHARRILRNHRLWEVYLIKYADIAPSHVDRDADEVEHVLSDEIIQELEAALAAEPPIPPSPHALEGDRP